MEFSSCASVTASKEHEDFLHTIEMILIIVRLTSWASLKSLTSLCPSIDRTSGSSDIIERMLTGTISASAVFLVEAIADGSEAVYLSPKS